MAYDEWHRYNFHTNTGECTLYGDHCTVAVRDAAHAEALCVNTIR